MRLGKRGIVGVEELLEDATGHDRRLSRSRWVLGPSALTAGGALPDPARVVPYNHSAVHRS